MGKLRALIIKAVALAIGLAYVAHPSAARTAGKPVLIFAASSLKDALDAALEGSRKAGKLAVNVSYAGSNTLARQIEQGAPADIFISADRDWMDYLAARKLVQAGTEFDLLGNRLVVIAPKDAAAPLDLSHSNALAFRLAGRRLALADTSVPAGRYARAGLEHFGLWDGVRGQLAQADNVRAALLFVARGEAPLGIVYSTDAKSEPRVSAVASFPAGSHPAIVYPAALVTGAPAPDARAVFDFLKSPSAQAVFEAQGFVIPGKPGT